MTDLIAQQLKALGHAKRLELFQLIRSQRFCCYAAGSGSAQSARVGDLVRECELAPSTVSHHLKELRTAGLIEMERCGQLFFCRAREDVLERLVECLRQRAGFQGDLPGPAKTAPVRGPRTSRTAASPRKTAAASPRKTAAASPRKTRRKT
jgi:ArsR family transcriptional regulator